MFAINQTVRIADKANFYCGRVGAVADRAVYGDDIVVYTVHVPSPTGNAVISCAMSGDKLEAA